MPAVPAPVGLASGAHGVDVAMEVARVLKNDLGIDHATIQPEAAPDPGKLVKIATRRSA
jgi:hypothetical protein